MEGLMEVFSWLASGFMVLGGALPYVPQYRDIRRSRSTQGFSTHICLVLLVANILRVCFWVGKQFEATLLLQSLVMIGSMLAMLQLCCSVQRDEQLGSRTRRLADLDPSSFWRWGRFQDYLLCCLLFCLLAAPPTLLALERPLLLEALGSLALLAEASLALPQLLHNVANRSTHGMSVAMVMLWLVGDVFKTGYFLVRASPAQFCVCGCVQVLLDLAVLLQALCYDRRAKLG